MSHPQSLKNTFFIIALFFTLTTSCKRAPLDPTAHSIEDMGATCERVPYLVYTYLKNHFKYGSMKENLEELKTRTIENFIKLLSDDLYFAYGFSDKDSQMQLKTILLAEIKALENNEKMPCKLKDAVKKVGHSGFINLINYLSNTTHSKHSLSTLKGDLDGIKQSIQNLSSLGLSKENAQNEVLERIKINYKNFKSTPSKYYYSFFVTAFSTSLDPHSFYYGLRTFGGEDAFKVISLNISEAGLGVEICNAHGLYPVVKAIYDGGAASTEGSIEPGDRLWSIMKNGKWTSFKGTSFQQSKSLLAGKEGSELRIQVQRLKTDELIELVLFRKQFQENKVIKERVSLSLIEKRNLLIAKIKIPNFYGSGLSEFNSYQDTKTALKKAVQAKANVVVLDLSKNNGGSVTAIKKIIGLFFESALFFATLDSNRKLEIDDGDQDDSIAFKGPIIVTTSHLSASASELLALTMKDYKRALIVGDTRTYGKGTQTRPHIFPNASATGVIAEKMFFGPKGTTPQKYGVTPHLKFKIDYKNQKVLFEDDQKHAIEALRIKSYLSSNEETGAGYSWEIVDEVVISKIKKSLPPTLYQKALTLEQLQTLSVDLGIELYHAL